MKKHQACRVAAALVLGFAAMTAGPAAAQLMKPPVDAGESEAAADRDGVGSGLSTPTDDGRLARPPGSDAPATRSRSLTVPQGEDAAMTARFEALTKRRDELDRRARLADDRLKLPTAAEKARVAELETEIERTRKALALVDWRLGSLQGTLTKMQQRLYNFAAPKTDLLIQPKIVRTTRSNNVYLQPNTESPPIKTLAAGDFLIEVAHLPQAGWVIVWIDGNSGFGYLPAGAVEVF